jgi:hypothetical protein
VNDVRQSTYTRDEILKIVAESQINRFSSEPTDATYQLAYLLAHFGIEVAKP